MKVWVIHHHHDSETTEVFGVYATKEAAMAAGLEFNGKGAPYDRKDRNGKWREYLETDYPTVEEVLPRSAVYYPQSFHGTYVLCGQAGDSFLTEYEVES